MTKDWFSVIVDATTGIKCVIKVINEETKNHKTIDDEITSGRIPAMENSKYCPIAGFEKYMEHLSPKSNNLWQTPKFNE